jgi:uncharacterized LabA/DUF88 family protein
MEAQKADRIAILIDGDNAQAKFLKPILEEVSKYGKTTIRRIYGDWTTNYMNSWKDSLNSLSFTPMQKFSYTSGKNSTDSALIIDAMDILHYQQVDGFCIVSSDSDYTGLAKRIREEGMFVMGIGVKTTPTAFVQSCEVFTFYENIMNTPENDESETEGGENGTKKPRKKASAKAKPTKIDTRLIDRAFDISVGEGPETYISTVGTNLRRIDPSFDVRNFGCKNLTQLFERLPMYEVLRKEVGGMSNPVVRRKER